MSTQKFSRRQAALIATSSLAAIAIGAAASAPAEAEAQPSMRKALSDLQSAEIALRKASSDKGGHRAKAIDLVQQAIRQVQAGIAFDNKN